MPMLERAQPSAGESVRRGHLGARAEGKPRPSRKALVLNARERLLEAAERLFGNRGYHGVSVREIARLAKVNLGSIPYYFGSKENLFKAVFLRRMIPVQEERRLRLEALTKTSARPDLTEVLRAIFEPAFRASRENVAFRRLAGRAALDPAPEVHRILADVYNKDFMITPKALRRACPDLPGSAFYWRLLCVYGVMVYVQADTGKIQTIAGEEFDTSRPDVALEYVLPFLAAGMKAQATTKKSARLRHGRPAARDQSPPVRRKA